jgi:hypothetical protein
MPELTITRRKRMRLTENTNDHQDTSKSYPAKLYKLDPSSDRSGFSNLSKDDSVIHEERETQECWEERDGIDNADVLDCEIEMAKAPAGKRFTRSISMPTKDMRSMMKRVEEKDRKGKLVMEVVTDKNLVDGELKVDENEEGMLDPEKEIDFTFHAQTPVSERKLSIDLPEGNELDNKPENIGSSEETNRLFLGSIDEDMQEEGKECGGNQVEKSGKEEGETLIVATIMIVIQSTRVTFSLYFNVDFILLHALTSTKHLCDSFLIM